MTDRARYFDPSKPDDGSIYAVGNGEVMVYGRGPEWLEVIGPVYSARSAFSLRYAEDERATCVSRRAYLSSVWTHAFPQGTLTDAASRTYRCVLRAFDLSEPLRFQVDFGGNDVTHASNAEIRVRIPAGAPVYNWYPSREHMWVYLVLRGGARLCGRELTLSGKGEILFVGAGDYPQLLENVQWLRGVSGAEILDGVRREDEACAMRRLPRVPALIDHPLSEEALRAVDDAATLIRAQQSAQGGVQAGNNYHLSYVRDCYGVFRGLLAAGLWEEAKAIMAFYRDTFAKYDKIANAQSMGNDGIFHVHENDETEITGYLALQAADMLRVTGDEALFSELAPLIEWALTRQIAHIHNGMLPFNGDETYIAGGILPRECINCGALEATYLFVTGAEACLPLLTERFGRAKWMDTVEIAVRDVRAKYDGNFRRGADYVCDSLKRLEGLKAPDVRHGVCNGCSAFGWNHRVTDSFYVCEKCLPNAASMRGPAPREYVLKGVVCMAAYTGASLIPEAYLRAQIERFLAAFRETGCLPSRPDSDRCPGYDYGLLLWAAKKFGLPADDLLERMLDVRDATGAWTEYYEKNQPTSTRCRPWESGINLDAALAYLKK